MKLERLELRRIALDLVTPFRTIFWLEVHRDILLLHDRGAARAPSGQPVSLEVLPRLLQRVADAGLRAVTLPQALHSEARA